MIVTGCIFCPVQSIMGRLCAVYESTMCVQLYVAYSRCGVKSHVNLSI